LIVTGNSYAEEKLVVIEREAKEDNRKHAAIVAAPPPWKALIVCGDPVPYVAPAYYRHLIMKSRQPPHTLRQQPLPKLLLRPFLSRLSLLQLTPPRSIIISPTVFSNRHSNRWCKSQSTTIQRQQLYLFRFYYNYVSIQVFKKKIVIVFVVLSLPFEITRISLKY
jgi:hypothetical protein